jgi:hypothetical protein
LEDKGYIGVEEEVRVITPYKGNNLTQEETNFNKKIGTDRVIIENFYGRMKLTSGLIRNKYKGSHADYDAIFEIACGLTNILLTLYLHNAQFFALNNYLNHRSSHDYQTYIFRKPIYLPQRYIYISRIFIFKKKIIYSSI